MTPAARYVITSQRRKRSRAATDAWVRGLVVDHVASLSATIADTPTIMPDSVTEDSGNWVFNYAEPTVKC